ncbi:MAG: GLPGLI family protein [Weeksellaceae bacterium]
MKNFLFSLTLLLVGTIGIAQNKQQYLEVDYQMEVKLDAEQVLSNVPAQWRASVGEQLKQEIKNGIFIDYKLKSNGTESEYKLVERIDNSQSSAGMILQQITAMDKEPLFKDIKERYYLKPYDFFGQSYLMKDSLQDFKWKITKEKMQIAGFDALKATGVMNDSVNVIAWYSPKLNFKDGPDRLWGLPGLILKTEFNMNDADMVITAINVNVRENELKIKKPNKGKILTEKEFEAEMKALQEKYKDMYGGGVDAE